jgi:parallel beta-helix repeat protein
MLQCDGDNWSVENLTFDMQDYFPKNMVSAITCKGANWRVANCAIIRIGRFGISAFGGDNWSIEGNHFTKTVPVGTENESINVSANKTGTIYATNARISDNVCEGSGIWFFGKHSIITHNRISRAGFGTGIGTGTSAHADALRVTGNICTGGRGFDENKTWVSGFELWAPNSVIANNTAYDNDGTGIIVGGQNTIVIGNDAYDNGVGTRAFGFGARYGGPVDNASGSIFIGNSAHNPHSSASSMTQAYGYAEQPGGLHDIIHIENDYSHNKVGPTKYNSAGAQSNVSPAQGNHAIRARISPAMKDKLKALNEDIPERARRALREYLDQQ